MDKRIYYLNQMAIQPWILKSAMKVEVENQRQLYVLLPEDSDKKVHSLLNAVLTYFIPNGIEYKLLNKESLMSLVNEINQQTIILDFSGAGNIEYQFKENFINLIDIRQLIHDPIEKRALLKKLTELRHLFSV